MSSDETPDVPAVTSTREAVREKAEQVRAKQARIRAIKTTVLVLLAAAVVGGIGYGVYAAVGTTAQEEARYPKGLTADGILITSVTGQEPEPDVALTEAASGAAEAEPEEEAEPAEGEEADAAELALADNAVEIHIYVDYMSSFAGDFQRANARQLAGWISEGAVSVTYHPVAVLTASSNGTKYSQRAAGAAACVATHSPAQFYAFNHELLIRQPAADSDGLSDDELAVLAAAVGVDNPKVVRTCIEDKHFVAWAKEATTRALEGPLPGTDELALTAAPTIIVNGQAYVGALDNPAEFSQFVLTVASDAYYATPAPTESPSPTPTAEG